MANKIDTGMTVTFIDGRSKDRIFKTGNVNDKYMDIGSNRILEVVDLKFQAFGFTATILNCPKELLRVVE